MDFSTVSVTKKCPDGMMSKELSFPGMYKCFSCLDDKVIEIYYLESPIKKVVNDSIGLYRSITNGDIEDFLYSLDSLSSSIIFLAPHGSFVGFYNIDRPPEEIFHYSRAKDDIDYIEAISVAVPAIAKLSLFGPFSVEEFFLVGQAFRGFGNDWCKIILGAVVEFDVF